MSRRRKDPLRPLTEHERQHLTRLSRATALPAVHVARAVILLAVADGFDYQSAARAAGRKSGDAVSHLVARFNREGVVALDPRHAGGRKLTYDATASCVKLLAPRPQTPTAPPPGRSPSSGEASGPLLMDSQPSRHTPFGVSFVGLDTRFNGPALGAQLARPSANVRPASRPSPTQMPVRKKVDRGRLHIGRIAWFGGLVRGRGWPVPDNPASRPILAIRGQPSEAATRIHPQWYSEGADPVSPG